MSNHFLCVSVRYIILGRTFKRCVVVYLPFTGCSATAYSALEFGVGKSLRKTYRGPAWRLLWSANIMGGSIEPQNGTIEGKNMSDFLNIVCSIFMENMFE